MKILAMGGCHTYGYGVPAGESFTERLAQELSQDGEGVEVDFLAPLKMSRLARLLAAPAFDLGGYDLIVLQLGHFELLTQEPFKNFFRTTEPVNARLYGASARTFDRQQRPQPVAHLRGGVLGKRFSKDLVPPVPGREWREWVKCALLEAVAAFYEIQRLRFVRHCLRDILERLAPYRERVLVLTPLPSMNRLVNTLRRQAGRVFREECQRQNVCVLDVFGAIEWQPYFFTTDGVHLNELGHHLLALEIGEVLRGHSGQGGPRTPERKIFAI